MSNWSNVTNDDIVIISSAAAIIFEVPRLDIIVVFNVSDARYWCLIVHASSSWTRNLHCNLAQSLKLARNDVQFCALHGLGDGRGLRKCAPRLSLRRCSEITQTPSAWLTLNCEDNRTCDRNDRHSHSSRIGLYQIQPFYRSIKTQFTANFRLVFSLFLV